MTAQSLHDRIAAAFTDGTKSATVVQLIAEAQTAAKTAEEAAQEAKQRALDPRLSKSKLDTARAELLDVEFNRERIQAAVVQLRERLAELKALEEDQKRRAAYECARVQRDKLAAELRQVYPEFADRLVSLFVRIAANDQEIAFINRRGLPRKSAGLLGAEAVARGLPGFTDSTRDIPKISEQLRFLPSFVYSRDRPYLF